MTPTARDPAATPDDTEARGLAWLALIAGVSGIATGIVGAAFRVCLNHADALRSDIITWAHQWPLVGWVLPVAIAALLVGLASWLVQHFAPLAAGSGVQHVEAVMRGEAAPAPLIVLPVKFVGGVLAIGSGLVLGREGPTVQMGATLGARLAELAVLGDARVRIVQSAAAGAGLAVAFNTPLGGIAFVFEELARRFSTQVMVATLAACGTAVIVARVLLGNDVDFVVAPLAPPTGGVVGACLVLGILLGVLGAAYNRTILLALAGFAALPGVPPSWRAAAVGAGVGLVAWFEPRLVGGGDPLIQAVLTTHPSLSLLATVLVARWLFGPLSYAAGTPGGLFAPLLVIGAIVGAIVAQVGNAVVPALAMSATLGAIVGMAAFFTAVVRAPLTGILLVLGMTGTIEPLVPMVTACLMATIVPFSLGSPPIYDTLRERMEHPVPMVPDRRQTAPPT